MSSPFRYSDRSPSSQRSIPSRSPTNGVRRVNGYHRPYRDNLNDSPSRQLLDELGRMHINEDRTFKTSLDEQTASQHKRHLEALNRALAKHEEVRESAERTRERVELENEKERRRLEDEERRAVEKARRDLEEQERRRELEEQRARDEEQKRQDAIKRQQDEANRRAEAQRQRDADERQRKDRQDQEESDKKARQEAEAKERAQQAENERQKVAQPLSTLGLQLNGTGISRTAPSSSTTPSAPQQASQKPVDLPQGLVSSPGERQATHKQYLDLHKRLKQMREQVVEETKKVSGLKDRLSEWRRSIKKCFGQLSKGASEEAKVNNRRAIAEIVKHLDAAAAVATPTIDITQYLVQNQQPPGATTQGPACLLFLLNHFAKNVVNQFVSETAVDPKSADVIGVLAVTVFARPQYLFNGQSLIDLLWAKYHKHCPMLFGVSGSERTKQGRLMLGWHVEESAFVREQEHYDRMSGLAAGFAAITLRNFSKSKNANPAPNRIYWESLARILNTPAQEVQPTHFVILKAMINNSVDRIIDFFGGAGIAILRQALIKFPNEKGPQDENGRKLPAVTAVQAMPMVLQRELHLTL